MKITKYLYLFVIIFLMFSLMNIGCGETNDLKTMEKKSIKAVRKAYGFTKRFELESRLENKPFFNKTLFFWVTVYQWTPSPIFIVAIDKKTMDADVFYSYADASTNLKAFEDKDLQISPREFLEMDIEKYSKIIAKESLILDQSNIESYIDSFIFTLNRKSRLINSIDDIKYLSDDMMSDIKNNFPDIGPPKYDFKGANISIEFFTYSYHGYLLKWNLVISQNGEVISFNKKEYKTISLIL